MKDSDPERLNTLGIIVLFVLFKVALIISSQVPKKASPPTINRNMSLKRNNKVPTTFSRYQTQSQKRNSPINRKMTSERNNKVPTNLFRNQTKSQRRSSPSIFS